MTQTPGTTIPAPPPGPGAYGQPIQPQRTNGLAVASLVLGIVWMWGLGSILALVLGYKAKRSIDESRGAESGRGLAIAGIVLGWIGVAAMTLFVLATVVVFSVGGSTDGARKDACRAERSTLVVSIEAYRAQTGAYPATAEDLVGTFLQRSPENFTVSGSTITATGECA